MQSLKKNWLAVSSMTWGIWWISPNHSKVWRFYFAGLFLSKIDKIWAKKYRGVIFRDTEQWCKVLIKPDLLLSKIARRIGVISLVYFIISCTLMGSFCPKHITFQVANFRGIMCHYTEGWCKIYRKIDSRLEKWHKEFG